MLYRERDSVSLCLEILCSQRELCIWSVITLKFHSDSGVKFCFKVLIQRFSVAPNCTDTIPYHFKVLKM